MDRVVEPLLFVGIAALIVVMIAYLLRKRRGKSAQRREMPATHVPTLAEVIEEIRTLATKKYRAGFETDEQIIEDLCELAEYDYKRKDLQVTIEQIASELRDKHRRAQEMWATPTDCDKLDRAFANLEEQGIVARQNFACCMNCGQVEIADEIKLAQKLRKIIGYTFYHMQDTASACETGSFWLAYGSLSRKDNDTAAVGHAVAEAIRSVGLNVEWDGSPDTRIRITGIDWKRRRE